MTRAPRLRLVSILFALQTRAHTLEELMDETGASRSTIQRDLALLRDAGVPVTRHAEGPIYSVMPYADELLGDLTTAEAAALVQFLRQRAPAAADSAHEYHVCRAIRKLNRAWRPHFAPDILGRIDDAERGRAVPTRAGRYTA